MPNSRGVIPQKFLAQRKVLHSWKDIANYAGRGVRTIQRYETELGFPVHRPDGRSRSAVLAFSDEVDEWLGKPPTAATVRVFVPVPPLTIDQLRNQREWLAVAANARRCRKCAQAMYEGCKLQSKCVQEMIERVKAARLRLRPRPIGLG